MQGALQWLEDNQDKSLDEIKAPKSEAKVEDRSELPPNLLEGEVAKSLVCNECGKKFRSHAQAEFHASRTYVSPGIATSYDNRLIIVRWQRSYRFCGVHRGNTTSLEGGADGSLGGTEESGS